MSQEQYREYAMIIHERLKKKGPLLQKEIPLYLEERYDKIWSDRLPQLLQMIIWYYFRQTIKVA